MAQLEEIWHFIGQTGHKMKCALQPLQINLADSSKTEVYRRVKTIFAISLGYLVIFSSHSY